MHIITHTYDVFILIWLHCLVVIKISFTDKKKEGASNK
jgi:hypothetical protein